MNELLRQLLFLPDQASTFAAFTDPAVYSRWMGVPVTIENDSGVLERMLALK